MRLHTYSLYLNKIQKQQLFLFFFFNDTATTEIYTLSLHDALPISEEIKIWIGISAMQGVFARVKEPFEADRKSTRLNSSHLVISYAVFCLKKKKKINRRPLNVQYLHDQSMGVLLLV